MPSGIFPQFLQRIGAHHRQKRHEGNQDFSPGIEESRFNTRETARHCRRDKEAKSQKSPSFSLQGNQEDSRGTAMSCRSRRASREDFPSPGPATGTPPPQNFPRPWRWTECRGPSGAAAPLPMPTARATAPGGKFIRTRFCLPAYFPKPLSRPSTWFLKPLPCPDRSNPQTSHEPCQNFRKNICAGHRPPAPRYRPARSKNCGG